MLQAVVGRLLVRPREEAEAGEGRRQRSSPAGDDHIHGWEPHRLHSRQAKWAETMRQRTEHVSRKHPASPRDHPRQRGWGQERPLQRECLRQQQLHVDEEYEEGWRPQPSTLPQSALNTAPDRRGVALRTAQLCRQGQEAGRVDAGAASSDRWAALEVCIPRLEVNGPTAKVVADGGSISGGGDSISSSSSSGSNGSVTAAAIATALSGVSSGARGWQGTAGTHASPASPGVGGGTAAALLAEPPSSGAEVSGIAPGNGATPLLATKVAPRAGVPRAEGGGVAVPSLFVTENRPLNLPVVRGKPEGTLNQPTPPQPPTPPSKYVSPVEIHVNEEGGAIYRFSNSAPTRRGKWSRMEEEYAKRIIRDFDEGVLDAPAGVGLRQLLSSKLHCEVMRVSKKFCGWQCVGKRCYRPVFHEDGRTTRARASLFEMEQMWLKTFPSPCLAKPARKPSIGNDGGDGHSTTPVDGASERLASLSSAGGVGSRARGATPAQTRLSREERGLVGDTSTWVRESPVKEGLQQRGSAVWEKSDEEPRGAPNRGEQGQEMERKRYDGRGLAWPVVDAGDQLQVRAGSRSGVYDLRRRHSVEIGSGSSVDPNGHYGMDRRSCTRSSSHGSLFMRGASPREPVVFPRGQHCENVRSPPTSLSSWQRADADRLTSGGTAGCNGDADPYPVFVKRREGDGGAATTVERVANGNDAAAGSGDEVSHASGSGWAQGQEARLHQGRPRFSCTNAPREGVHARENTHEGRREGRDASAGGMRVTRREHDVERHLSAADETHPDPFPLYESERQRAASGSYAPRRCGNGGRADRSGVRNPAEAAVGRQTSRMAPEPGALPLRLRVDNHRDAFLPGSERALEPERHLPPPKPSSEHHSSPQFSEGPDHYFHAAKEERRAWEDAVAGGLEGHRPVKTPRVVGSFSHAGAGVSSDDRGVDDAPLYPRYQKRQHQREHRPQQQQQQRRPGSATATHWQSGRSGDNGNGCATTEAYIPASRSNPMRGDATHPHRPSSRDLYFCASASPISMVVPSNEYGSVVEGPTGPAQPFGAF